MKFRTEVKLSKRSSTIDHTHNIILLGSCFSDNIGKKLMDRKFNVISNPFGVLFNPFSISNLLQKAINLEELNENLIEANHNLWHSFELHGSFSAKQKIELVENGNKAIKHIHQHIKKTDYLFVTFGTAWVYEHKQTGQVVANCHKFPPEIFNRYRLSIDVISKNWEGIIQQILAINPNLKIVFTVSPIRHLKDGFHENQLSKATLHLAIEKLIDFAPNTCSYFPSYEIVMDDLRDYRFYQDDLVHISTEGVDYIYEQFEEHYFNKKTIQLNQKLYKITKATEHLVQDASDENTKKFSESMLSKIKILQHENPHLNFTEELKYFQQF